MHPERRHLLSTHRRWYARVTAASLALAAACGGAPAPPPVPVPELAAKPDAEAPVAEVAEVATPPLDAGPPAVVVAPADEPVPPPPEPPRATDPSATHATVFASFASMRRHPLLGRSGPIWAQLPSLAGTKLDPVRDFDWVIAYGPSFVQSDRMIALARHAATEGFIDDAIARAAARSPRRPLGPWDAGRPELRAKVGVVDQTERVFIRPDAKHLLIAPTTLASPAVAWFKRAPGSAAAAPPSEVLRITLHLPGRQSIASAIPLPEALTDLRLWLVTSANGGADAFLEGDCRTPAAATELAADWTKLVQHANSLGPRIATRGLLNSMNFTADKTRVSTHVVVREEQLEAILQLLAAFTNVTLADAGP